MRSRDDFLQIKIVKMEVNQDQFEDQEQLTKHLDEQIAAIETSKILCKGEGSFLSFVMFGDEIYWDVNKVAHDSIQWQTVDQSQLLPSDSSLRSDIIAVEN